MSDPLGNLQHVSPLLNSPPPDQRALSSPSPTNQHDLPLGSPPQSRAIREDPSGHISAQSSVQSPAATSTRLSTSRDPEEESEAAAEAAPYPPSQATTTFAASAAGAADHPSRPPTPSYGPPSPTDSSLKSAAVATATITKKLSGAGIRGLAPQLSERDSIFATHYLTGDSSANTPRLHTNGRTFRASHADQDVTGSMVLPGPVSPQLRRASSVDSVDAEERARMHMAPDVASSSGLPGQARAVLVESKLSSEIPQEAEDGHTDIKQDGSGGVGARTKIRRRRSEEQIQATIAKDEPIGFARSRKASHYHGLFRGDAAEKKDAAKASEASGDGSHPTPVAEAADDYTELDDRRRTAPELERRAHANGDVSISAELQPVQTGQPADTRLVQASAMVSTEDSKPDEAYSKESVEWHSCGTPLGAYPIRVLEEIRAFPGTQRPSDRRPEKVSQTSTPSTAAPTAGADRRDEQGSVAVPSSSNDEGEESEKEHISAATYYPHQAPSPEEADKGQERAESSFGDGLGEPALPVDGEMGRTKTQIDAKILLPEPSRPAEKSESDNFVSSVKPAKRPSGPSPALKRSDTTVSSGIASETEPESEIDDGRSDDDELADVETTPTATPIPTPAVFRKRVHRAPLGAVELKPYKHQVGGHTKVFSFSKQAICKELNNRENAFYEVIERRHPELLEFMPRYLGVLNVTYTKAKRKPKSSGEEDKQDGTVAGDGQMDGPVDTSAPEKKESQARMISHSLSANNNEETVARVIYANNMHIIPRNLFPGNSWIQGHDVAERPQTAPGQTGGLREPQNGAGENGVEPNDKRPTLKQHYPSWGATTVNQKLKEKVLRDVFSPPVIHHKHPRRSVRSVFHAAGGGDGSDQLNGQSNGSTQQKEELEKAFSAAFMKMKTSSDLGPSADKYLEDVRGTSAPGQNSVLDKYKKEKPAATATAPTETGKEDGASSLDRHVTRRRSDQGLLRKRRGVNANDRGELKYYEDEGYQDGRQDDIFAIDLQSTGQMPVATRTISQPPEADGLELGKSNLPLSGPAAQTRQEPDTNGDATTSVSQLESISEAPANPLVAQLQPDERVRHFLLLEDLTAGMKKPCVLDLKMGTRQYGIEANAKKQNSQRLKCKMTTSRQLGVRICGMQRWDVKTQQPVFEDKYAGRDLRAGREFQNALRRYLHDGVSDSSMIRHIPVLLEKLSRLEQIIQGLPRYRFYASSLLMIYDAAELPSQKNVDRGGQVNGSGEAKENEQDGTGRQQRPRSSIDIKLIDFANCVTSQTKRLADAPCPPQHANQPDRGYIMGLKSLRSYLQLIWQEVNADESESWMDRGDITQKSSGRTEHPEGWRKAGEGHGEDGEVSE